MGPLLLLQLGTDHAPRVAAAVPRVVAHGAHRAHRVAFPDSEVLPSQLVRFEAEQGTAAAQAPASGTTGSPTLGPTPPEPSSQPASQTQTQIQTTSPPTTTTTDPAPVFAATADSEEGQATWYAAAPPGRCASPTLPFGTVLTVTNLATGAQTVCTVDDREQAGYPRVVDLSPSGFEQLAGLGRGVVDVIVSW
ncbi:MAG: septal ring lytic transglycosylase RlpA family protein [Acidimicrobiales bacterium]